MVNQNHDMTRKAKIGSKRVELVGVSSGSYAFKDITSNAREYLLNKSDFSSNYKSGKKFVAYFVDNNSSCPIMQAFTKKMGEVVNSSDYSLYYDFVIIPSSSQVTAENASELHGFRYFYSNCNGFCIVNPVNDKMFIFSGGVGYGIIGSIEKVLDQLKDW